MQFSAKVFIIISKTRVADGGATVPESRKAVAVRSSLPGSAARRWGVFCPIFAQIPDYGLQKTARPGILRWMAGD